MPTEHISQSDCLSLLVEELIGARLAAEWQCPTLLCNTFDMAAEFNFLR